jgi:hypothetical protein
MATKRSRSRSAEKGTDVSLSGNGGGKPTPEPAARGTDAPGRTLGRTTALARGAGMTRRLVPDHYFEAADKLLADLGGPAALVGAQARGIHPSRVGLENIRAIYIGRKREGGLLTGELCIKVKVGQKVANGTAIDSTAKIDRMIKVGNKEIPTDIEPMTMIRALQVNQAHNIPTRAGSSIGLTNGVTGTLGAFVFAEEDDKVCILTNNHVAANVNFPPKDSDGDVRLIQPGLVDAENQDLANTTIIGLLRNFGELNFSTTQQGAPESTVDAAIVWTKKDLIDRRHHHFEIDPEPAEADFEMRVLKDGRTTGRTSGRIVGIHVFAVGAYEPASPHPNAFPHKVFTSFRGQLAIEGDNFLFSDAGDSGSLIVDADTLRPVGLLWGGATNLQTGKDETYANPIQDVMDELEIGSFI